jgi:hypothetical protein
MIKEIFDEYKTASRICLRYFKEDTIEPIDVTRRYKIALTNLQSHLDVSGMKMPIPIYRYKREDRTTWKILDVIIATSTDNRKIFKRDVPNDKFKYYGLI